MRLKSFYTWGVIPLIFGAFGFILFVLMINLLETGARSNYSASLFHPNIEDIAFGTIGALFFVSLKILTNLRN